MTISGVTLTFWDYIVITLLAGIIVGALCRVVIQYIETHQSPDEGMGTAETVGDKITRKLHDISDRIE